MSEPEFPRYFRRNCLFRNDPCLLRMTDAEHYALMKCDGSWGDIFPCPPNWMPQCVAKGSWVEIPRDEAEDKIRRARGEE